MIQKFLLSLLLAIPTVTMGADLRGRMGIGATNQLANELPAISLKVQQSKTFAIGALLGFKTDEDNTLYGAGIKFYRIIFDEPQLNFYMAGLFASQSFLNAEDKVESGYQVDGTLGTEFHFAGLESLGFSAEFGVSARNVHPGTDKKNMSFQTLGDQFLKAAVHFYL